MKRRSLKKYNLTKEELQVLNNLAAAWTSFLQLNVINGSDQDDFLHAIHAAQNIILARSAYKFDIESSE